MNVRLGGQCYTPWRELDNLTNAWWRWWWKLFTTNAPNMTLRGKNDETFLFCEVGWYIEDDIDHNKKRMVPHKHVLISMLNVVSVANERLPSPLHICNDGMGSIKLDATTKNMRFCTNMTTNIAIMVEEMLWEEGNKTTKSVGVVNLA